MSISQTLSDSADPGARQRFVQDLTTDLANTRHFSALNWSNLVVDNVLVSPFLPTGCSGGANGSSRSDHLQHVVSSEDQSLCTDTVNH